MVAEGNETQSKQKAQHTKEEIKALENFLRLRFGMTSTEVSSVWRQYGTAKIARMQQEVYDADMVTAMQTKAQTQEEEMTINEEQSATAEYNRHQAQAGAARAAAELKWKEW